MQQNVRRRDHQEHTDLLSLQTFRCIRPFVATRRLPGGNALPRSRDVCRGIFVCSCVRRAEMPGMARVAASWHAPCSVYEQVFADSFLTDAVMPIGLDKYLGVHAQALNLRSQRTELLAANLANADTPGYRARDIDFKSALAQAAGTAGATNPVRL